MATDSTNGATSAPVAIVTGGASGMGLAVTRELVAKGWNVAILDYNEDSWQSILQDFDQDHVTFMKTDVMDYEQQSRAFVQTWKRWQKLDFVFSNAVGLSLTGILSRLIELLRALVTRSISMPPLKTEKTAHLQSQTHR